MILKPGKLYKLNEAKIFYSDPECSKHVFEWVLKSPQIILLLIGESELINQKWMKKVKILTGTGIVGWICYPKYIEIFSEL